MKKLFIGILTFLGVAGISFAYPPSDFWNDSVKLEGLHGYEQMARSGGREMRENWAKLDKETESYSNLSLKELREGMNSKGKVKSFRSAWAIYHPLHRS